MVCEPLYKHSGPRHPNIGHEPDNYDTCTAKKGRKTLRIHHPDNHLNNLVSKIFFFRLFFSFWVS